MQNVEVRKMLFDVLSDVQVLYQNKQIDNKDKNEITKIVSLLLTGNYMLSLRERNTLNRLINNVDEMWEDNVNNIVKFINITEGGKVYGKETT